MLTNDEKQAIVDVLGAGNDVHKYYVYALCDKNDHSKIFYIGKGEERRVWSHKEACAQALADIDKDDSLSVDEKKEKKQQLTEKFKEIIRLEDQIEHVIVKWGLLEYEAFMCESALINLWKFANPTSPLTNIVNGHANDKEKLKASESKVPYATRTYSDEEFHKNFATPILTKKELQQHFKGKVVLAVSINKTYKQGMSLNDVWEITKGRWVIAKDKPNPEIVIAVYQNHIKGIFEVETKRGIVVDAVSPDTNEQKLIDDMVLNASSGDDKVAKYKKYITKDSERVYQIFQEIYKDNKAKYHEVDDIRKKYDISGNFPAYKKLEKQWTTNQLRSFIQEITDRINWKKQYQNWARRVSFIKKYTVAKEYIDRLSDLQFPKQGSVIWILDESTLLYFNKS